MLRQKLRLLDTLLDDSNNPDTAIGKFIQEIEFSKRVAGIEPRTHAYTDSLEKLITELIAQVAQLQRDLQIVNNAFSSHMSAHTARDQIYTSSWGSTPYINNNMNSPTLD